MGVFSGLDLGTSRFYDGVALADAAEREKMALEELRRNRELQKRKSQIGTPDYNYNPELGAVNPGSLAAVGDPEDYSAIDTEPTTRDFREPGLTLRDTDKRPVTNEEFGTAVFGPEFTSPEEQLKKVESLKNVIPFWESGPAISRDPVYTYDDSGRRRPDTGLRKLLSEVDSKNYSWGAGQIGAVQYTILKREGVSAYDYAARQFYRSPEAFRILSENPRLISEFKENPTELYKKLRKAGVLKKEDSKHMRTNIARGNKEGFMPDAVEFFGDISALETKAGETKKSKDYAAKRVESVTKSIATDRLENKVSVYTVKQAELLGINRYHALTLLAMESDFGTTGEGKNNPLGITAETYNDMIAGKAGYAALSENIKKAGVADSYAKSSKEDRILMGLLRFKYSKDIGVDNDKLGAAYNGSAEKANENLYDKQNKLYIVNVSSSSDAGWYLEAEYEGMGCKYPESITKTAFGVCWINENGVYAYNGQSAPVELTIKLDDASWFSACSGKVHAISYNNINKQLVVFQNTESGTNGTNSFFVYDFLAKAWFQQNRQDLVDSNGMKGMSNIVSTVGGMFVAEYAHTGDDKLLRKLSSGDSGGSQMNFRTKDIDFGEPGKIKKIYKVYVTALDDGSSAGITMKTLLNGNSGGSFTTTETIDIDSSDFKTLVYTVNQDCESIRLQLTGADATNELTINDITIEYRAKYKRAS